MKNLYVGNLPHSTTETELRNIFETHGAVEKITLVTDRETGRWQPDWTHFVHSKTTSAVRVAAADARGSHPAHRRLDRQNDGLRLWDGRPWVWPR